MKIIDGYDSMGKPEILFNDLLEEFDSMCNKLANNGDKHYPVESLYEVGCGCGPNILLADRAGYCIGGCDFSKSLIESAREVFGKDRDLSVCEAIEIPAEPKYDAIFSNGVFCYFDNKDYAYTVLEKMLEKSNYSIAALHVIDSEKEEEYMAHRRQGNPDYDEKYKGLERLFLSRKFFEDFAEKHSCDIEFNEVDLNGYMHNGFCFDVYMYKQ